MSNVRNRYKVAPRIWSLWSPPARALFNSLYAEMRDNPDLFLHTYATRPLPTQWRVTAWNAAWRAAFLLDDPASTVLPHS